MPTIKTNKQYDALVTFGCSFTGGHQLGPDGAWGHFLAKKLNCKHMSRAGGGSNTNILTAVMSYCEGSDTNNICIGIQWSEITRRELWEEANNAYYTIGLGGLSNDYMWSRENSKEFLGPVRNNLGWFSSVWFDIRENTLRTVLAMIQLKAYLEYKNIDFIQFEGINSILNSDKDRIDVPYYGSRDHVDISYDGSAHPTPLSLINNNIRQCLVNDDTFFSAYGDLNKFMRAHPAFNPTLNDGHPHPEILIDWANYLYDHIKKVENRNQ